MRSIRVSPRMTPEQCQKARILLNWTAADLARAAGVSAITVRNFEAGKIALAGRRALVLMQRAMEGAGIRFGYEGDVRLDAPSSC